MSEGDPTDACFVCIDQGKPVFTKEVLDHAQVVLASWKIWNLTNLVTFFNKGALGITFEPCGPFHPDHLQEQEIRIEIRRCCLEVLMQAQTSAPESIWASTRDLMTQNTETEA